MIYVKILKQIFMMEINTVSAAILSKDLVSSGGFWGLGHKSEIKLAPGMESVFCSTSKSNSQESKEKTLAPERQVLTSLNITEEQRVTRWHLAV